LEGRDLTKKEIAPFLLKTADIFGEKAKEYIVEKAFGKHLLELKWILKNCGNNGRILDVGGGLGVNLITLKSINKNLDVYLIDKLEEYEGTNSLENPMGSADAGKRILREHEVNLIMEDFWYVKKLPFESGFFDIVTCFDVIEHFPENPLSLLKEMKRILKKDGALIMCAPNLLSTARRGRLMLGMHPYMHFDLWMAEKYDKYYGHYREYTRKEYQVLLERSGFSQIKTFMISEPTRTKAFNSYHHKKYRNFSLPAIGLWLIYLIEIIFPGLRTEVYCTAKRCDS
jgi:ubiquinone/menaquinone biosynthesis C-methylase UbiE